MYWWTGFGGNSTFCESIWVCRCPKHFISICFTFSPLVLKPPVLKIAPCVFKFDSGPSDEKEVIRWDWYKNTKTTQTCLIRGMFTILAEATAANGTKRWKKNDNYTDSELILHNFHNVAPEALESLPLLLPKVFSNLIWINLFLRNIRNNCREHFIFQTWQDMFFSLWITLLFPNLWLRPVLRRLRWCKQSPAKQFINVSIAKGTADLGCIECFLDSI